MSDNQLSRFHRAQVTTYPIALREIQNGHKETHWIWYIFPQLCGLGHSPNAQYFGIADANEARQYLDDPVLGARLLEITSVLLQLSGNDPNSVMGYPDTMKLRSCMTLFAHISGRESVFQQVLDKYYGGCSDDATLQMLKSEPFA